MDNFTFYSPTYFVFGKDTEKQAGECVKRFGGSKVLLHFGGKSAKASGLLDRVEESLKAAGLPYVELGGVKPNPRSGLVYEGIELCKKEGVDIPRMDKIVHQVQCIAIVQLAVYEKHGQNTQGLISVNPSDGFLLVPVHLTFIYFLIRR